MSNHRFQSRGEVTRKSLLDSLTLRDSEWEESKHPRVSGGATAGQFGKGGGGKTSRGEIESNRLKQHYSEHATSEELNSILGPSWTIAPKTASNLQRYKTVITRKEYEAANQLAISQRSK